MEINPVGVSLMALVVALVAALGPAVTALVDQLMEKRRIKEARREWRRDYLHRTMQELINLRARLQYLQDKGRGSAWAHEFEHQEHLKMEAEREMAYGKAYGLMLTVPSREVRGRAQQVMDSVRDPNHNEKLQAIDSAIKALGDLHEAAMGAGDGITELFRK